MKKMLIAAVAAPLFLASCGGGAEHTTDEHAAEAHTEVAPEKATYNVDVAASVINWHGYAVANSEEHMHKGTIKLSGGSIMTEGDAIKSATVSVDMASMAEPGAEESMAAKLIGHLGSPDFFNVEAFGEAAVQIDEVKDGMASGKMMLLGKEGAVSFPVSSEMKDGMLAVNGTFAIDLAEWGIPGLSQEGEDPLSTSVNFDIALKAKK